MRGFQKRTPVTAALQWLDNAVDHWLADRNRQLSAPEVLPIHECCGRVLAQDLVSNLAVPGFERAMMDGYAVRSEDLAAVSADHSARLVVVGESLPGRPFAGEVACGAAVRIMTGAPFPLGAGAVIPVELTQQTADSDILILGKVPPGKHVGRVGEDISKGERLLAAGRKLRPQDVAAASSIGIRMLPVFQRPRVAHRADGERAVAGRVCARGIPDYGFERTAPAVHCSARYRAADSRGIHRRRF
jgi:molybdopterin molybdotransferase